jgi:tRNA A-37 threonylcarbamoyl transferase component Bud32
MVSYVSSNIHLHDILHHTLAFINIHLDIHRIIIITYKLASASKEKASKKREKEAILCFAVYAKKGRCFSPMAQKY